MYSLLTLLCSIVIYCHKFLIVYKYLKGERVTRVSYKVLNITKTHWLELLLRLVGLLLRLLSSLEREGS